MLAKRIFETVTWKDWLNDWFYFTVISINVIFDRDINTNYRIHPLLINSSIRILKFELVFLDIFSNFNGILVSIFGHSLHVAEFIWYITLI